MATITTNTFSKPTRLKKSTGIYCIQNKATNKIYVGQSLNIYRRWEYYFYLNNKDKTPILSAIKKYGLESFSFTILEECGKEILNEKEIYWIAKLNSIAPNGYNLSTGGRITTWLYKPSKETLLKRSASLRGQKRTAETKFKMSLAQKGRTLTKEHKDKISKAKKGRSSPNKSIPMSESAKRKMVLSKTGSSAFWRKKSLIRNDGVVFDSILEASKVINAHRATIHKHLKGALKTVHGYTFKYGGVSLP